MGPKKSKGRRPHSGGPQPTPRAADWRPDSPTAARPRNPGWGETWPEPAERQTADPRSPERRRWVEDDDQLWDVFLSDEQDEDPVPQEGDFWLDQDDPPQS